MNADNGWESGKWGRKEIGDVNQGVKNAQMNIHEADGDEDWGWNVELMQCNALMNLYLIPCEVVLWHLVSFTRSICPLPSQLTHESTANYMPNK